MSTAPLGSLERVPLRDVWASESSDFTPWLASAENIALLGETLQLDLEVEGEEQPVGPYRADILCKDTTTDRWVVIENQLDGTDHGHLGKLLTYAAGLQAMTVVWVAEKFTDEHRAALDWLNQVTNEDVHFFGLEMEAWKIGSSLPAPKFNVVCQPNDWSRVVAETAKLADEGSLSPEKQKYLSFWQQLVNRVKQSNSILRPRKARGRHFTTFSLPKSKFKLVGSIHDDELWASLSCPDETLWPALLATKPEADKEAGIPFEPEYEAGEKYSYLGVLCGKVNLNAPDKWPPLLDNLKSKLETMHKVFAPRVRAIEEAAT